MRAPGYLRAASIIGCSLMTPLQASPPSVTVDFTCDNDDYQSTWGSWRCVIADSSSLPSASSLSLALGGYETAPIDPSTLAREAERVVGELLAQGSSENTKRSYRAALRYWAAWYYARYRRPIALPLDHTVVLQFIVDHVEREDEGGQLVSELPESLDAALVKSGFKGKPGVPALNTLKHRVSVLSQLHQARSLPNPCREAVVSELLSRTRRAYAKRGAREKPKPALVKGPLERLLATCDESLRGKRDRALLLFAWSSGGRRRSEVSTARYENLKRVGNGFVYTLGDSGTNEGRIDRPQAADKPIQGLAAQALREWLKASRIVDGPLFRRIRSGDRIAEGLSASAVRDIVKARCALAGLDEDFSAQSLRSGFVAEARSQGASIADIMHMTGHTSATTVVRYHRRASASNGAARLLDGPADTVVANRTQKRT